MAKKKPDLVETGQEIVKKRKPAGMAAALAGDLGQEPGDNTRIVQTSMKFFDMPKSEHAIGIRSNDPPATPDAPHAPNVAIMLSNNAITKATSIPNVLAAASVIIVIVIAAPSILMVAPRGIDTE